MRAGIEPFFRLKAFWPSAEPAVMSQSLAPASAEGQTAFNLKKGSIPARTDVPADEFPAYQQSAMESFGQDTIASSIAHGAAVPLAWLDDISTATAKFYSSKDGDTYVADLVAAAQKALG